MGGGRSPDTPHSRSFARTDVTVSAGGLPFWSFGVANERTSERARERGQMAEGTVSVSDLREGLEVREVTHLAEERRLPGSRGAHEEGDPSPVADP